MFISRIGQETWVEREAGQPAWDRERPAPIRHVAAQPPGTSNRCKAATGRAEVCTTVLAHNPNVGGVASGAPVTFPANPTNIFDGGQVGQVFGC